MGKVWALRPICLVLVLVALATQGLTPDAVDLASPTLFRILNPAFTGAVGPALAAVDGDRGTGRTDFGIPLPGPGPSEREDPEDSPDEVCTPVVSGSYHLIRRNPGSPSRLKHLAASGFAWPDRSRRDAPIGPVGIRPRDVALIHFLCRMTC